MNHRDEYYISFRFDLATFPAKYFDSPSLQAANFRGNFKITNDLRISQYNWSDILCERTDTPNVRSINYDCFKRTYITF